VRDALSKMVSATVMPTSEMNDIMFMAREIPKMCGRFVNVFKGNLKNELVKPTKNCEGKHTLQ